MSKITPSPWSIGKRCNAIVDSNGTIIANCEFSHSAKNLRKPTGDECKANARLIAAAPEMLAALKEILSRNGFNQGEWAEARAAIAKAEGKKA